MHVRILPVSYLLDTTYLSYPTTDIFSRAHAWGVANKCILRWVRIDQRFGYEPTQAEHELTEFGYEKIGYETNRYL